MVRTPRREATVNGVANVVAVHKLRPGELNAVNQVAFGKTAEHFVAKAAYKHSTDAAAEESQPPSNPSYQTILFHALVMLLTHTMKLPLRLRISLSMHGLQHFSILAMILPLNKLLPIIKVGMQTRSRHWRKSEDESAAEQRDKERILLKNVGIA